MREIPPGFVIQADGSYSKPKKNFVQGPESYRSSKTVKEIGPGESHVCEATLSIPLQNETDHQPQSAVIEPAVCDEPLATEAREGGDTGRVRVSVISFRKRLCDPDNLCPKYFIDCLRYAAIIRDDRPQDIELSVSQEKSKDEKTTIEITALTPAS